MNKRTTAVLFSLTFAILISGCNQVDDQCAKMMDTMARCYPDVPAKGNCTAETAATFQSLNPQSATCSQISNAGKSDWFAFGGCGKNEHVCGLIFCCDDDYPITRHPKASEWNFVDVVKAYQDATPTRVKQAVARLSNAELHRMKSFTFRQDVVEKPGAAAKDMAVEISVGLINVPYHTFIRRLPPANWGVKLAMYLGGQLQVVERNSVGQPIRQVERMVLSPFPCGLESPLSNMDMTKVEQIEYSENETTVYWRVYASDNKSTEADVGKVSFEARDGGTLVTFHSAHRLNFAGGLHMPLAAVELTLKTYFIQHIKQYRDVVTKASRR